MRFTLLYYWYSHCDIKVYNYFLRQQISKFFSFTKLRTVGKVGKNFDWMLCVFSSSNLKSLHCVRDLSVSKNFFNWINYSASISQSATYRDRNYQWQCSITKPNFASYILCVIKLNNRHELRGILYENQ